MPKDLDQPTHFKGKDAIGHVIEAQAQGLIASAEIHGMEAPGYLSSGADAARDTALLLLLLWTLQEKFSSLTGSTEWLILLLSGWVVWKAGRSGWLGWSRLERLHRVLEQERWEIQHHRQQERSELRELYAAKGFEGKLLDDVIDVLMADDNRLLRVMVEEELGLSLASQDHPLQQAMGAFFGSLAPICICIGLWSLIPNFGVPIGAFSIVALSAAITAHHIGNRIISSVVWNVGLAALAYGTTYYLMH